MKILLIALLLTALPGLFSGGTQWYVSHTVLLVTLMLTAVVIYRLSRYHPAALLWLILCTWDVLLIPLWLWAPHAHSAINWFVWPLAVIVTLWHITRRRVRPQPHRTYLAFRRPHTAQGWLLAASGLPGGSCAVISGGYLYTYRRGIFTRNATYNPASYVIIQLSKSTTHRLDDLIGTAWTWRSNCLTLAIRVILWTR